METAQQVSDQGIGQSGENVTGSATSSTGAEQKGAQGFASMDPDKQREIASMGGKHSHDHDHDHKKSNK
jgi:general stress protein YciG